MISPNMLHHNTGYLSEAIPTLQHNDKTNTKVQFPKHITHDPG